MAAKDVKFKRKGKSWVTNEMPDAPHGFNEPNWVALALDFKHSVMLLDVATRMRDVKPDDVKAAKFYCYAVAQMIAARDAAVKHVGPEISLAV